MFDQLDFIYMPSRDVAGEVAHFVSRLGGELVFAIEAFGTRVAMVRLNPDPPALLLAGNLQGDRPVLVYRALDLDQALAELGDRGVQPATRFEMPHGPGAELVNPGPQRIALYQLKRPRRMAASRAGATSRDGCDRSPAGEGRASGRT